MSNVLLGWVTSVLEVVEQILYLVSQGCLMGKLQEGTGISGLLIYISADNLMECIMTQLTQDLF